MFKSQNSLGGACSMMKKTRNSVRGSVFHYVKITKSVGGSVFYDEENTKIRSGEACSMMKKLTPYVFFRCSVRRLPSRRLPRLPLVLWLLRSLRRRLPPPLLLLLLLKFSNHSPPEQFAFGTATFGTKSAWHPAHAPGDDSGDMRGLKTPPRPPGPLDFPCARGAWPR